jgi:hypothetical protein
MSILFVSLTIILDSKGSGPGSDKLPMIEIGKVILRVSVLSEPLELARLTRTAPNILVCIDRTKDFSCDL